MATLGQSVTAWRVSSAALGDGARSRDGRAGDEHGGLWVVAVAAPQACPCCAPHAPSVPCRGLVWGQPHLCGHRQGRAAVCGLRRQPERAYLHRLLPPAAARHARSGASGPGWPSGAPLQRGTRRSWTPTSGCGRTSSTTGSAAPVSTTWTTSKPKALAALHQLQKLPHLVQSFFRDPNLRYITAW